MAQWPQRKRKLHGFWEFDDPWLIGPGVDEYYGPNDLLTVLQVADLRGCSDRSVRNSMRLGTLPYVIAPDHIPHRSNAKFIRAKHAIMQGMKGMAQWTEKRREQQSEIMKAVRARKQPQKTPDPFYDGKDPCRHAKHPLHLVSDLIPDSVIIKENGPRSAINTDTTLPLRPSREARFG